jgi:predicted hydrocarbon binding protein
MNQNVVRPPHSKSSSKTLQVRAFDDESAQKRAWSLFVNGSELSHFLEFSPTKGSISNKLRNSRVFFLSADIWADMETGLYEVFGGGASIFIQRMGRDYGASFARKIKPYVNSVSTLKKLSREAGFGDFAIRADEENGTWIRVHALNCVFCQGRGHDHRCSFLAGIVQGAAEEFYGKSYTLSRSKCYEGDGTHTCEVVLQESYHDPPNKRRRLTDKIDNPLGEEFR